MEEEHVVGRSVVAMLSFTAMGVLSFAQELLAMPGSFEARPNGGLYSSMAQPIGR